MCCGPVAFGSSADSLFHFLENHQDFCCRVAVYGTTHPDLHPSPPYALTLQRLPISAMTQCKFVRLGLRRPMREGKMM